MNISCSAPIESAGISLKIVDLLEKYHTPVPLDFLAKELGRRPERLLEDLAPLEERGIVRVDRQKELVALAGGAAKKSALTGLFHWISGVK